MKKALIAALLVMVCTASPALAQRLVPFANYTSNQFYLDVDSFRPADGASELYYYVYGFGNSGDTVTLNIVNCSNGSYRKYKSWQIKDGKYVNEQAYFAHPVFLRGHFYHQFSLLRNACQTHTTASNW